MTTIHKRDEAPSRRAMLLGLGRAGCSLRIRIGSRRGRDAGSRELRQVTRGVRRKRELALKPHLIVHMAMSIDGRTLPSRWRPRPASASASATPFYERIHEQLNGDAWMVGRVTGQEFAKADGYATHATEISRSQHEWRLLAPPTTDRATRSGQ